MSSFRTSEASRDMTCPSRTAPARLRGETPRLPPLPAQGLTAPPPRAGRGGRRSAPGGWAGRARPSLCAAIATISVRKSGLPRAARAIRSRSSAGRRRDQLGRVRAANGSSRTAIAHSARRSSSSGRAMQTSRIGRTATAARLAPRGRGRSPRPTGCRRTRTMIGALLQQLPKGPGDVVCGRAFAALAEQGSKRGRSGRVRRQDVDLLQHLDDGPVRDPVPVGEAPTRTTRVSISETSSATNRDFPTPASPTTVTSSHRPSSSTRCHVCRKSSSSSARPTNDVAWRAPGPRARRTIGGPGRDRFALQLERLDRLGVDRAPHECKRLLADQDFAGLRRPAPGGRRRSPRPLSRAAPRFRSRPRRC